VSGFSRTWPAFYGFDLNAWLRSSWATLRPRSTPASLDPRPPGKQVERW